MTFTDEDLKRLKEDLHKNKVRTGIRTHIHYRREPLEALLARLEAAEALAEDHAWHEADCSSPSEECDCGYAEDRAKWRKAAGK